MPPSNVRLKGRVVYLPVLLVFIVGSLFAYSLYVNVREWRQSNFVHDFELTAHRQVNTLQQYLDQQINFLYSIRNFYYASSEVEREEFRQFVDEPLNESLSIQAIQWVPRVSHEDRYAFEGAGRLAGLKNFAITEKSPEGFVEARTRNEYYPVLYVEPYKKNHPMLGFDYGAVPVRLEALLKARDLNEAVVTHPVPSVHDEAGEYSILVVVPIYERGYDPDSLTVRREHIEGFVVGILKVSELLKKVWNHPHHELIQTTHYVYDINDEGAEFLISNGSPPSVIQSPIQMEQLVHLANRRWKVISVPEKNSVEDPFGVDSIILILGLLLNLMMSVYLFSLIRKPRKIEGLVRQRTIDLQRANEALKVEIKDRWAMEKKLTENKNLLDTIVHNIPYVIFVKKAKDLKYIHANKAAQELAGIEARDILDKVNIDFMDPEEAKKFEDQDRQVIKSKQTLTIAEERRKTKHKGDRLLRTLKIPILDAAGTPQYVLEISEDITDKKVAQRREYERNKALKVANDRLLESEKTLLHVLEDLKHSHDELRKTQENLVQAAKLESVGRLAAGVAHEVKNPLAILLQGVEFLKTELDSKEVSAEVLNDMLLAIRRADDVIKGLLDFSSNQELNRTLQDLNEVVSTSLDFVKHEIMKNHIQVNMQLDVELPTAFIDPQKIQQVLVNLFLNAVQAMPESGQLNVRTLKRVCQKEDLCGMPKEKRDFGIDDPVIVIEVEDSGEGLADKDPDRLFDPFYTTKYEQKGTGLGLSVSHSIITLNKGTIRLENRTEGGVRVVIVFPDYQNQA